MSEISKEHEHDLEELGQECSAPESGQVIGGREDPWEGEAKATEAHEWPEAHHASPSDEL